MLCYISRVEFLGLLKYSLVSQCNGDSELIVSFFAFGLLTAAAGDGRAEQQQWHHAGGEEEGLAGSAAALEASGCV